MLGNFLLPLFQDWPGAYNERRPTRLSHLSLADGLLTVPTSEVICMEESILNPTPSSGGVLGIAKERLYCTARAYLPNQLEMETTDSDSI